MLSTCNFFLTSHRRATVNELSCTIDLDSTLIRAEALFKRFQRLVDAVDKKGNFPAPRPRLTQGSSESSAAEPPPASSHGTAAAGRGRDAGKAPAQSQQQQQQQQQQKQPEKVITPELRRLLSRQVEVLPRKEVAKKGDGLGGMMGK